MPCYRGPLIALMTTGMSGPRMDGDGMPSGCQLLVIGLSQLLISVGLESLAEEMTLA